MFERGWLYFFIGYMLFIVGFGSSLNKTLFLKNMCAKNATCQFSITNLLFNAGANRNGLN